MLRAVHTAPQQCRGHLVIQGGCIPIICLIYALPLLVPPVVISKPVGTMQDGSMQSHISLANVCDDDNKYVYDSDYISAFQLMVNRVCFAGQSKSCQTGKALRVTESCWAC